MIPMILNISIEELNLENMHVLATSLNQKKKSNSNPSTMFQIKCTLQGLWVGMGIVENSTMRFGSQFCFYGSVLSRFPKRFINDISWIRNYAMECVAELA